MKRRATVVTLMQAPLLTAGLAALADTMTDWDISIIESTPESIDTDISRIKPSLLIADPLMLGPADAARLREHTGRRMKIAALYISALPPYSTAAFDDAVSVYARPEAFASLIADAATRAHGITPAADAQADKRDLSPREKEVVAGVVKGLSNKEIAAAMGVSVNTVTTHRRNIAAKLKIHSPAGLTIYAIVSKLVSLDEVPMS